MRHRALARRRGGEGMRPGTADVVLVLGDVGEMREEAERTDQVQRLIARQGVEHPFELLPRGAVLVAAKADRALADALDGVERRVTLLLTHRVAEDAAEQPDVLAQRQVLVFAVRSLGDRHEGTPATPW